MMKVTFSKLESQTNKLYIYVLYNMFQWRAVTIQPGDVQKTTVHFFTLSNAKHGRKYWNRSRGKLDFKGSSGKNYGTHGLN